MCVHVYPYYIPSLDPDHPSGAQEWTELMSASLRAEGFREKAQHYALNAWLLQQRLISRDLGAEGYPLVN